MKSLSYRSTVFDPEKFKIWESVRDQHDHILASSLMKAARVFRNECKLF